VWWFQGNLIFKSLIFLSMPQQSWWWHASKQQYPIWILNQQATTTPPLFQANTYSKQTNKAQWKEVNTITIIAQKEGMIPANLDTPHSQDHGQSYFDLVGPIVNGSRRRMSLQW
jgi:hypothetical protein